MYTIDIIKSMYTIDICKNNFQLSTIKGEKIFLFNFTFHLNVSRILIAVIKSLVSSINANNTRGSPRVCKIEKSPRDLHESQLFRSRGSIRVSHPSFDPEHAANAWHTGNW